MLGLGTGAFMASARAEELAGLCGQALAEKIAAVYAPQSAPTAAVPPQWLGGGTAIRLIPAEWTGGEDIVDAYNTIGASHDFVEARLDFIPAVLVDTVAWTADWAVGHAILAETEISAWTPALDRRGDIARRYMYLATLYGRELWHGQAPMFLADGRWPLFTAFGSRIMLMWHRADPVDSREVAECQACGMRQGNCNPFVEMPELAEHIWGDRAEEGFVPPVARERKPLASRYSRKNDRFIDLYSPYVPEGAEWSLDGKALEGDEIPLENVPVGTHTLQFVRGQLKGRVIISITD